MTAAGRRRGIDTRAEIRKVALELFTEQGYDATSLREIAERLDITKAALYYHFKSKEDIVRSLFTNYLDALDAVVEWAKELPPGPELATRIVDRMVDVFVAEGMPAMRFATANHRVIRELRPDKGGALDKLAELSDVMGGPDAPVEEKLRLRSALLSVNVALLAAQGLEVSDDEIARVARDIAHRLVPHPERAGTPDSAGPAGAPDAPAATA
ncbi:TetR/AcrR family transcriptional regulator [Streptomyces sp. NBC_00102]|uniref:TetR/AcrR family transcriptional regulator n=1 Tax=Streptomyces sp. NBC_00102 TaxID=2975652 RepID=UPI0022591464|nr:TetR/AcrR family transcriptional regulator [Streptomyces sp. NBC_00102]MCX5397823.1 TetR/AcrR family transcriptional regulator [Streptomyces sp. NBC_00102]